MHSNEPELLIYKLIYMSINMLLFCTAVALCYLNCALIDSLAGQANLLGT